MNDPTPQKNPDEIAAIDTRQRWQKLDFEKIAASDAEGATPVPGAFDGTTYS